MLQRRDLLRLASSLALMPFAPKTAVCQGTVSAALAGESLFRDVIRWADIGEHRTGTEGDLKTGNWIFDRLQSAGLKSEFQGFALPQVFLKEATLRVDGRLLECFPFGLPPLNDKATSGPLTMCSRGTDTSTFRGHIAVFSYDDFDSPQQFLKVVGSGVAAILLTCPHPDGELTVGNPPPPFHRQQTPIPILFVAAKDLDRLKNSAAEGKRGEVTINGEFRPKTLARNVLGRLDLGSKKWCVVSTPASGWFQCVGERGSGVALLLGLATWAARRQFDCNWLFAATTGHELGHVGMQSLMDADLAPPVSAVNVWLVLGASIATRKWEKIGNSWVSHG